MGILLIKIIYGRANHPLSRVLVELVNGVVKTSLHCWLADYSGKSWSDKLALLAGRLFR